MDAWGLAIANLSTRGPVSGACLQKMNAGCRAMKQLGADNRAVVESAIRAKGNASTHQIHLATGLSRETCYKHLRALQKAGRVDVQRFRWWWLQ